MTSAVEILGRDLQSVRTGRATPMLLDRIQVDYYGSPTPINGVANISAPDPRMVVVQPWDRSMLGPIEKAIQKSDLGINPTNDGQVIRLVLPQLTQDRRKELVKQVQDMQERLLRDPEAARALEELLKYFQVPPEDEGTNH